MPACSRCGEENPARARFCLACGASLEGQSREPSDVRKTVTVLFCDVTNSTGLAEGGDPEQLRRIMSSYFAAARTALESHGGRVEKFIGDAVMAVFGVPVVHEDDALRALRAAVDVREAIVDLNVDLRRSLGTGIEVRIGVNTGEVVAGDPSRGGSLVSGEAVTIAERLERSAEPGGIVLGEATYRLARDAIEAKPLGPLALKGKTEPVQAYRLASVRSGAPAHARRFDSPMVGRERELALLRGAFKRAVRERACHLFTVLGAAGVGKSRLVAECLRGIGEQATVLTGGCLPYGEAITFWPLREIVREAAAVAEDSTPSEARRAIESIFGGEEGAEIAAAHVAEVTGLAEARGGVTEEGFRGVRRLFDSLARRQPLVVVLDDLNWGEPRLLDLVDHVVDWSQQAPILLVCMARPDLLDLRPGWGGGKRNATAIFLEPLSEPESDHLLANLLGGRPVAGDARSRIGEAAEGNPLFVEEMVAMLIDEGLLRRENGHWEAAGDLSSVAVPASIQVLLASRLDQLGADERRVIERASVEGAVFHRGALEALAGVSVRGRVAECLLSLVRKELIRPERATFAGEDAYRFRHALIRDAAYDALPKIVRSELHERYAAWLEARPADYDELIGYHLEQAFRYRTELASPGRKENELARRAGKLLGAAGLRALARGDMAAASNLLERAVVLVPPDDRSRLALLPELGLALRESGELARADRVLSEAIERATASGDRQVELKALVERVSLRLLSHTDEGADELLALVDAALPTLEELGDDRTLAQAWYLVARARHLWRCRFASGESALERALEHARRAGDRRQEADVRMQLSYAAWAGPTPVREAERRCEEILSESEQDTLVEAGALRALAALRARRGELVEARELLTRARNAYDELGMRLVAEAISAFGHGDIEMLAGDYGAAERALRTGYEALDRMGEKGYRSTVAGFLGQALHAQGRDDEAERFAAICAEGAFEEDVWTQVLHRSTRAKILARRGDYAEAEALAREAHELASATDGLDMRAGATLDLAEVLRLSGREEESLGLVGAAVDLYERKENTAAAARARSLLRELTD